MKTQTTVNPLIAYTSICVAVALIGGMLVENLLPEDSSLRIPLMLLQVGPLLVAVLFFAEWLRRLEELKRRIHFEGLAIAFIGTALLTYGYGLIEEIGEAPRLSWIYVAPLMVGLWMIGSWIAERRYS